MQHRTAVACRLVFRVGRCAALSVAGQGTSVSNVESIRRVLGAQPMLLYTAQTEENRNHTKAERNIDPRDVHPFVNSNVMHTATRLRAALPLLNVQSSLQCPMT